jgi:uncharacterized membrane protein
LKRFKAPTIQGATTKQPGSLNFKTRKLLIESIPLLTVLAAYLLVAVSLGPYSNGDTAWEFDATQGVLHYGLPYAHGFYLMDQPPLGFYIQAAFATVFGLNINYGTFLVTLFGLGCVALLYAIGTALYNKTTGYFAALLFALSPWHLILSRSFLIDTPCLFFSLLTLFAGILAVNRNSLKLCLVTGVVFAAAFLTKLYAVYMLIPLGALFVLKGPKNLRQTLSWVLAFVAPALAASVLWYDTVTGIGLMSIFRHADFNFYNTANVTPTYFFVNDFLVNILGWFFIDATILSLVFCLVQRRLFKRYLFFDLTCLVTILVVLSVNIYLGATLDLKSPYLNTIKYAYQSLPFFSLLVASLITKSLSLHDAGKTRLKLGKAASKLAAYAGVGLVAASLLYSMWYEHLFSTWNYMIFRVQPNFNFGYSLFNWVPITVGNPLMAAQYVGFAVALSGVVWVSRHKLGSLLNRAFKNKKQ